MGWRLPQVGAQRDRNMQRRGEGKVDGFAFHKGVPFCETGRDRRRSIRSSTTLGHHQFEGASQLATESFDAVEQQVTRVQVQYSTDIRPSPRSALQAAVFTSSLVDSCRLRGLPDPLLEHLIRRPPRHPADGCGCTSRCRHRDRPASRQRTRTRSPASSPSGARRGACDGSTRCTPFDHNCRTPARCRSGPPGPFTPFPGRPTLEARPSTVIMRLPVAVTGSDAQT